MKKRIAYCLSLVAIAVFAAVAHATTVSGGTPTIQRVYVGVNQDGSEAITISYSNAAGAVVHTRTLFIDSGCTRVVDNLGNVVSATGPTAVCNAEAAYAAQIDSTLQTAAAAGKLGL